MKINPYPGGCSNRANCPYRTSGNAINTSDSFCSICGAEFNEQINTLPPRIRWTSVIVAAGLILALVAFFMYRGCKTDPVPTPIQIQPAPVSQPNETPPVDACLSAAPNRKNVFAEIRQNGVKIAVESDAPPFNEEVNGKQTGFDYEIAREVAKRIGVPSVKMVYTSGDDYGNFPCFINDKRADWFMGGYIPTADFEKLVSWSDSYYPDNGYCLVVKNGSGIKNVADLKGKRVAVYDEDAAAKFVETKAQAIPVRFTDAGEVGGKEFASSDQDQGKWMLLATRDYSVDAILYDYPFAVSELENCEGKLKIVQYNLGNLPYSIGLPSGNDDLLEAVNKALAAFIETPAYGELVRKYISPAPNRIPLPSNDSRRAHVVIRGETLSGITAQELGSISRWREVWEWNKDRIPNPNLIQVGDKIVLEAPQ